MSIQVFKPRFFVDECLENVRECLEQGWTGNGYKTKEFEEAWKQYTGHKNACFLNSSTAGLHLAVKILKEQNGWQTDDEIISTPITFVSTNEVILYEGLRIVFADVDEFLCLNPDDVKKKITSRTRAIMFVGYGGHIGRLKEIIQICRENNLRLILDAAHMAGTFVDGVCPGTWDGVDVAVYSYQAVKNLPTGDSGMVCFAEGEMDKRARVLSWMGIDKDTFARTTDANGVYTWDYSVDHLGCKYNGNSIMAAIALAQLKHLDEDNNRRREIAKMYDTGFNGSSNITVVSTNYREECSYHLYEIVVPDRDGLLQYLRTKGINCGVHYRDNSDYSAFKSCSYECKYAKEVSKHLLTLPLHLCLSNEDVKLIISEVNRYYVK